MAWLCEALEFVITPTGTVKMGGGFVASSLDISNEDFLGDQYKFNGNGSSAGIRNEGVITVGRGGYAALIGGTIRNDGLIAVPMGKVGLGSGEQATLDLSGDGFLQVAVPTGDGEEGKGALVENDGTISAEGGTVVMHAATARNAARHAVNLSGVIEAKTVSGKNGAITIGGGDGGAVSVSGKVLATAKNGKGGKIKVTGQTIALKGATVDASGANGGGTIRIGGDYQGKGSMRRAATTTLDNGTAIHADATQDGSGGTVVVWSDDFTRFDGLITARGVGAGRGGDVEVSGKAKLDFTGKVNLTAQSGQSGNLLLDPYNVTISSGSAKNSSGLVASGNDSVISVGTLTAALAMANVEITTGASGSQAGNIHVATNIAWSANTTLTLSAAGNIKFSGHVVASGDSAGLVLNHGNFATNGSVASDTDYSFVDGASITLSGANAGFIVNGDRYKLIQSVADLGAVNVDLAGRYALAQKIDLAGTTYPGSVIGSRSAPFYGTLTGLGNTVSNLDISATANNTTADNIGLFGYNLGTVRDIGLVGGQVEGRISVGALVGDNGGTVSNSYSTTTVRANNNSAGGLVGRNTGLVSLSHSSGSVSAPSSAGGLIGQMLNSGLVRNSYSTGAVTGGLALGGLVGSLNSSSALIERSYATGTVTATGDDAGGLVGRMIGSGITHSYATGAVSGVNSVGGLVGRSIGDISYSYATGAVSGVTYVGGLAGEISGNIRYAYALGSVTGQNIVGGLVGTTNAGILQAYATGKVTGVTDVGGVAGYLRGNNVQAVYFNRNSAAHAVGRTDGTPVVLPAALSPQEARNASNYSGWDFGSVWYQIGDMRPILRAEGATAVDGVTTISNLHQLALIWTNLGGRYVLDRDIDASLTVATEDSTGIWGASGWRPLGGDTNTPFTGTLDGAGHTISGLTINAGSTAYTGLFAANTGQIRNLGLVGGQLNGNIITGSLAGWNTGTITNVYSTMPVSGVSVVGGLVGFSADGAIISSYASGQVNGSGAVGGLVGMSQSTDMISVYATGAVSGSSSVGGLIGLQRYSGSIAQAYATGPVSGTTGVGGFIGEFDGGSIWASFFDKTTTGHNYGVGQYRSGAGSVTPLTTAQFQNTEQFYVTTSALGWDFQSAWAPPASGYYPELYALSRVVTVRPEEKVISYGNATPVLSITTYGGPQRYIFGKADDTLATGATASTGVGPSSNIGTYTSTVSTPTAAISEEGAIYRIVSLDGTVRVDPRQITVTGNDVTRIYGDANPTLGYIITSGNLVNGDTLTGAVSTLANAASDAGTYTISGGTLAAPANYAITYLPGTFTVTPRALTVTAGNATRIYGDANPALTYAITAGNLVNGDALTGNITTVADATSGVGTYAIAQGTLGASANYALTFNDGSIAVTPASLTVTANNGTMVYGAHVLSLGYSVTGWQNGQDASLLPGVSVGASATSASDVGSGYVTTASGGLLSGAASGNYNITYAAGAFTVTPAALTVTAENGTMTYGANTPSLSYSVTGWQNGQDDSLLSGVRVGTNATSTSNVGSGYSTTASGGLLSGAARGNYTITYAAGDFIVTPASLTVKAGDGTMTYGANTPSLGYSVTGWQNGQDDSLLSGVRVVTSATSTSNAGSGYVTTASGGTLSGASSGNYNIIYVGGVFSVSPASLAVTVNNVSKPYDGRGYSGRAGLTYTGFVQNEDESVLGGSPSYGGTAQGAVDAGSYKLTVSGLLSNNYLIIYVDGFLTVTPPSAHSDPSQASLLARRDWFIPVSASPFMLTEGPDTNDASALLTMEDPRLATPICFGGTPSSHACGAN